MKNESPATLYALGSSGFVASLTLLILNDFLLKQLYPCWVTGKLSDFAGLFAFSFFLFCIFPFRIRQVCVAVALGFIFWKSSFSQVLIDAITSTMHISLQRTVDYGDLVALTMLPLAARYYRVVASRPRQSFVQYPLTVIALLAFVGTTAPISIPEELVLKELSYVFSADEATYSIPLTIEQIVSRLEKYPAQVSREGWFDDTYNVFWGDICRSRFTYRDGRRALKLYEVDSSGQMKLVSTCNRLRSVIIELREQGQGTKMTLKKLFVMEDPNWAETSREQALRIFENTAVSLLNGRRLDSSGFR